LSYQWYFNGSPVGDYAQGGRNDRLTIPHVSSKNVGSYWCEIDGVSPVWGTPARTRTRLVVLSVPGPVPPSPAPPQPDQGSKPPFVMSLSTNNIPPTPGVPTPPGNPPYPNGLCGTYCSYALYQNSGVGYQPTTGTTRGIAKVQFPLGTYLANTSYDLLRTSGFNDRVCATNVPGSATDKAFPSNPQKHCKRQASRVLPIARRLG
jgi:hypothetical protein